MKETLKVKGQVRLVLRNSDGSLIEDTGFQDNIITNAGLAAMAGLVGNTGAIAAFTYLAVGTDATAASASQTALQAELATLGLARAAATVSRSTTTQTNDTLQLDYTWTASGTTAVEEIGIFNAASTGIMLGRKVTGTKNVANGVTLAATYKIIFT